MNRVLSYRPTGPRCLTAVKPGRSVSRVIAAFSLIACSVAVMSASSADAAGPPAFVQQVVKTQLSVTTAGLAVAPVSNVTLGNRLIVLTEMWSYGGATAASVTDSAANTYTKLLSFKGPDGTEMSVWSAPITAGGGTKPTITVKPTGTAGIGFAVLEYSGLSTVNNATIVDQVKTAGGTTGAAGTVASGATPALTTNSALVLGFYVDSGFDATVTPDPAYTQRVNNTPALSSLFVEDRILSSGATPNATATTGSDTVWLMATLALKSTAGSAPTAPAAPTGVSAVGGDQTANVTWTAPSDGGSPITSYTVTPYVGATAQTPKTITGTPPATNTSFTGLTNGTAYTFRVSATNAIGPSADSAASNSVTPAAPPAPPRPLHPPASPLHRATRTPTSRGLRRPTVAAPSPATPSRRTSAATAQTPTTVTGTPPATATTITGLTNGTAYTFKIAATNAIGTGPESAASNAVTPVVPPVGPTFVQQTTKLQLSVTTAGLGVAPTSNVTAGNRLIVLTEMWSYGGATAASVTDSAG